MAVRNINVSRQQAQQQNQQATIWLNVGVKDSNGEFISLPYGLAVDTMKEANERGDAEWRSMAKARNELLSQILALADNLNPGEGQFVNLEVQLYKAQDQDEADEVMHELPHISFSF